MTATPAFHGTPELDLQAALRSALLREEFEAQAGVGTLGFAATEPDVNPDGDLEEAGISPSALRLLARSLAGDESSNIVIALESSSGTHILCRCGAAEVSA